MNDHTPKGRLLLWLSCVLILIHALTTMVTYPEFHVLDSERFDRATEAIRSMPSDSTKGLITELTQGRWNGEHGQNLARRTLVIDALLLVTTGLLIIKSRRKNPQGAPVIL